MNDKMVVGGYLISSTFMRVKDAQGIDLIGLPKNSTPQGYLSPQKLKERCASVFQLVRGKMKNLVIVNSIQSNFEMIQACVEVAEQFSENVMFVPQLLAILTYAVENVSKFRNPPNDEVILVVYLTQFFADFVILKRNPFNFKLYIFDYVHHESAHCEERFPAFYQHFYPHSTIFIVHESCQSIANRIEDQFNPENCFINTFKKIDYVLLFGALYRAMSDEDGFDPRYQIDNFSSGYDTVIYNNKLKKEERHVLLPERSALPCKIYGFHGIPRPIKVCYFTEFCANFHCELAKFKREVSRSMTWVSGSAQQVIGYVDERGVPYFTPSKETVSSRQTERERLPESEIRQNPGPSNATRNVRSAAPNVRIPSPINNSQPQIKFIFRDNLYGIQVFENGVTRMLADSGGNEWTPLYLSKTSDTLDIGEKAKSDYQRFPKYVIYDVLKIIGKPMNEIQIDPRWGFELFEIDRNICFQIETSAGPRRIPQEIVISAFLKAMKLQTESILDIELKEICLSTTFRLSVSQKAIFETAAAKNAMEILFFNVTDIK